MKKSIIFIALTLGYILILVTSCSKHSIPPHPIPAGPETYLLSATGNSQIVASGWIHPFSWRKNETSVPVVEWTEFQFTGPESEQMANSTVLVYARFKEYSKGLNVNHDDPVGLPIQVAYTGVDGTTNTEQWTCANSSEVMNISVAPANGRFVGTGGQRRDNEFRVILLGTAETDYLTSQGYQNGDLYKIGYHQLCQMFSLQP